MSNRPWNCPNEGHAPGRHLGAVHRAAAGETPFSRDALRRLIDRAVAMPEPAARATACSPCTPLRAPGGPRWSAPPAPTWGAGAGRPFRGRRAGGSPRPRRRAGRRDIGRGVHGGGARPDHRGRSPRAGTTGRRGEHLRLPRRNRPVEPPRPRGGQRRSRPRSGAGDRRGGARARPPQDPPGRPRRQERAAGGLRGTSSSGSAPVPATPRSPEPCTRPCPASSRPARATARSRRPSTSSTARRTGPAPRTGKPTSGCFRQPSSRGFRRPGTSSALERPDVLAYLLNAVA